MSEIVRAYCPACGSEKIKIVKIALIENEVLEWKTVENVAQPKRVEADAEITLMGTVKYECLECGQSFDEPRIEHETQEMTPVERFMFRWKGHRFSSSTGLTDDFRAFSRDIKTAIVNTLPEHMHCCIYVGHFYIYGFFENDLKNTWAYFDIPDVRFFQDGWIHSVLIRTAKDNKDYVGGKNNTTTITSLVKMAVALTEAETND